jgi:Redoxin
VVVVWWSLHCPFCVRHNTRLTALQARVGMRPLRIITAVREPDAPAVRLHMQRYGHRFAVTLEAQALSAALSTRRVSPLTATVDRQGRLRQVIPGEMAEDDMMELLQLSRG